MNKIRQQSKPGVGTLLRMALHSEDIIPRHGAGKGDTVICCPRDGITIDPVSYTHLDVYKRQALHSEDIIPRHGAGKGDAVIRCPRDGITIDRINVITMHKIETGTLINTGPEGV